MIIWLLIKPVQDTLWLATLQCCLRPAYQNISIAATDPPQPLPSVCSTFGCAAWHIVLLPSLGDAKQAADIH